MCRGRWGYVCDRCVRVWDGGGVRVGVGMCRCGTVLVWVWDSGCVCVGQWVWDAGGVYVCGGQWVCVRILDGVLSICLSWELARVCRAWRACILPMSVSECSPGRVLRGRPVCTYTCRNV